ncbi:MAG: methylaspartate mutase subunit S [Chloroflexi bacterium]|nr:methylaspartate mutase subunit S [Chloroflexota bacterium]
MTIPTVVLGTIGADAHIVAGWLLKYSLEQAGFKVAFLGSIVSQEEFINAAMETKADAIWVSSIYGHAPLDCQGLRNKCDEAGLRVLLYIGGNLSVSEQDWAGIEKQFKQMGFDRVYASSTMPETAIADLKTDLRLD